MVKISYKTLRIYKYQLTKQYKIDLGKHRPYVGFDANHYFYDGHILLIRRGYRWDGPSGPTIDTDTFMRGSLVHDVLYQAIREGHLPMKYRKKADKILYRLCREHGMSWVRAWYTYKCVRLFGRGSAKS